MYGKNLKNVKRLHELPLVKKKKYIFSGVIQLDAINENV